MTLNELADSVYYCSVGNKLNGEKKTKENFRYWFKQMFCDSKTKHVLFSMEFPDGEWMCMANRFDNGYGFDYYVPDTRKQEAVMLEWWRGKRG